jgi:hypothetical protein
MVNGIGAKRSVNGFYSVFKYRKEVGAHYFYIREKSRQGAPEPLFTAGF